MFPSMRRTRQEISREENEAVLARGSHGILSLMQPNGYPYALPISYVYEDGTIYMHCAKSGAKIDALNHCDKASFCVVDQDEVIPERFSTNYRSVIAFGTVSIVKDEQTRQHAFEALAKRYSPTESEEKRNAEIASGKNHAEILALQIEKLSGKIGLYMLDAK